MKTKWIVFGIAVVLVGLAVIAFFSRLPGEPNAVRPSRSMSRVQPASTPSEPVTETAQSEPGREQVQAGSKPKQASPQLPPNQTPPPSVQPSKEALQDPDAREALALVGMDPAAEQYWLDAIFDTSLPDNEREDLMEDLNETGFSDPKNLTAGDLPLIMNRLEIIDAVLPSADEFMADHLLEAQKDLVNMYARLMPNQ